MKLNISNAVLRSRISCRTLLLLLLLLGVIFSSLFVRTAVLVLESAASCSAPIDCFGWRLFGGADTSQNLTKELMGALVQARDADINEGKLDGSFDSFHELVKEMTSKQQDIKAFAIKTKAMLLKMEQKVQIARKHELIYWHLASHGIPESLHCLFLELAEEYAMSAMARSRLPPPEHISRLADPSFHHVVLLTDNIIAASVVVSSTIENSLSPEKLVFHIVTDKKTYAPMHAWFAINPFKSAVVEVKGLHQYDWSHEVNVGIKQMMEIHHLIWSHNYNNLKEDLKCVGELDKCLEALNPSCLSLLNNLRTYIPELFPDLKKIVFLDHDVVIQHDLSSLWTLDLNGKVVGAVVNSECGQNCCLGRLYRDYFNFSHPLISSKFNPEHCAWLYGMNVFDLEAWRRSNVTAEYQKWLQLITLDDSTVTLQSLNSGLALCQPGVVPPALAAFQNLVHPIDPLWHVAGLGRRPPDSHGEMLEAVAVIHFSGPAKPWLEIGFPEVRKLWSRHVNSSNMFVRKCRIIG